MNLNGSDKNNCKRCYQSFSSKYYLKKHESKCDYQEEELKQELKKDDEIEEEEDDDEEEMLNKPQISQEALNYISMAVKKLQQPKQQNTETNITSIAGLEKLNLSSFIPDKINININYNKKHFIVDGVRVKSDEENNNNDEDEEEDEDENDEEKDIDTLIAKEVAKLIVKEYENIIDRAFLRLEHQLRQILVQIFSKNAATAS